MSARPLAAALFALALLTTFAGCGGTGSGSGAEAGRAAGSAAETSRDDDAAAGESGGAASFSLPTLDGEEFRFEPADSRVTLLDFWATWCAPCREEVPFLKELEERWGDRGFRLVAISDESEDSIREFVDEYGIEYVNLVDDGGEVGRDYRVLGLPTGFLVDSEGEILWTMTGLKNEKALEERIAEALGGADGAS